MYGPKAKILFRKLREILGFHVTLHNNQPGRCVWGLGADIRVPGKRFCRKIGPPKCFAGLLGLLCQIGGAGGLHCDGATALQRGTLHGQWEGALEVPPFLKTKTVLGCVGCPPPVPRDELEGLTTGGGGGPPPPVPRDELEGLTTVGGGAPPPPPRATARLRDTQPPE